MARRRALDATVQVKRSRARRVAPVLRLALVGLAAFGISVVIGVLAIEASTSAATPVATPRAATMVHVKTLDIDEPAAFVRLVAMERPHGRRATRKARN